MIARTFSWLIIAGVLLTARAYGDIIYLLDNPVQSGAPGDILHFTGTVTNTGPESFSMGFGHSFLGTFVPTALEFIFPADGYAGFGIFHPGPGESFTGELFDFLLTPTATGVIVDGSSFLYSWPDGSNLQDFDAVKFSNPQAISIAVVAPEPRSAELFLAGAALLVYSYRKTRGASSGIVSQT